MEMLQAVHPMNLRIRLVCPAPAGSRSGNRVTAVRWARILRSLGHRVDVAQTASGVADILVALHARRSADAVQEFRARYPCRPLIVALTGTDLYHDLGRSRRVTRSLTLADRLIVLQPAARTALPAAARSKARVIYQSATPPKRRRRPLRQTFDVCILSHLRPVKDPLRAALAARCLPPHSRIRVLHAGRALTPAMAARARAEAARNPRYRWLGERSHAEALALLARSRLLVLPSQLEGGANVVGEAAVCGVPVLASRVDGSVGLLGSTYQGYFPYGDTRALAALLYRAAADPRFLFRLTRRIKALAPHFRPARERAAWKRLPQRGYRFAHSVLTDLQVRGILRRC